MGTPLVADLWLRGTAGPLRARLHRRAGDPVALVLWLGRVDARFDGLPAVVLELEHASPGEAVAALEWAADHGAELGAGGAQLIVGGAGEGAVTAVRAALHAHRCGWPPVSRLVPDSPEALSATLGRGRA
jgi:hypothetical protein